jgi:hypothetical protein
MVLDIQKREGLQEVCYLVTIISQNLVTQVAPLGRAVLVGAVGVLQFISDGKIVDTLCQLGSQSSYSFVLKM